ncbi:MAG: hypothetical protein D6814_15000 [Calditrichaeota bacterium]|nr:MAG: hypothetical protein D6814_15000 [Calditrichota bacterium]
MTLQLAHYWALGEKQPRGELLLSGGLASYNVYECADGRYLALGALEPKFWQAFCELVEHPEWQELIYARGKERDRLQKALKRLFKTKTREQWLALAGDRDLCLTPVLELDELEQDPQLQAREMIIEQYHPAVGKIKGLGLPLKFSESQPSPPTPAPLLGQDTEEVLREVGWYSAKASGTDK